MSMEQRITTLEELYERVLSALRSSNSALQRYHEAAALRDQAMMELNIAVERAAEAIQRAQSSIGRLEESAQEVTEVLQSHEEAMQALLAFVPVTQAEIVRLDHRIDTIEGA